MARNMARAGAEVVPATVTDEVVVDHWNAKTDITGELVLAVVEASRAEPALNAWYDGSKITRKLHRNVDLGIAMDTPEGLFVPVLRQAETKSAAELRAEIDRLKQAVALRQVAPSELAEASLTLSNFGLLGGRHAALVVVPPQVAIVGAGKVAPSVVPIGNRATVRMTLPLSLTFDHRAVTGGEAARFLAQLVKVLSHGH
jgi:pyruvate dehydrogenase E2 component (dihydrolipoamide acetyltransferase)